MATVNRNVLARVGGRIVQLLAGDTIPEGAVVRPDAIAAPAEKKPVKKAPAKKAPAKKPTKKKTTAKKKPNA